MMAECQLNRIDVPSVGMATSNPRAPSFTTMSDKRRQFAIRAVVMNGEFDSKTVTPSILHADLRRMSRRASHVDRCPFFPRTDARVLSAIRIKKRARLSTDCREETQSFAQVEHNARDTSNLSAFRGIEITSCRVCARGLQWTKRRRSLGDQTGL